MTPEERAAAVSRQQARRQNLLNNVSSVRVPMAPRWVLAPATDEMAGQAQTDGVTIRSQGGMDDRTMAHEMAHNLDFQVMTDSDRARFARIMGFAGRPWERLQSTPAGQVTRHGSLSERFADMTAMLVTRQFPKPGRGGGFGYLDDPPSMRELLRFGRALERLGARNGLARYERPR